jgi:TRAP-type C4-dicarboxylate transport system substrate-binding protein
MKKKLFVVLSVLVIAVLVITGCGGGTTTAAQPVELKLAHAWATTHHVHVILDQFAKDVAQATNNRVKITIYPGGALSTAVQLYDTVSTGVADMAWFLQGYTPGKFPLTSVMELPFMATSSEIGSQAMWDLYEDSPEMQAEYANVKVLSMWVVDPGQLMTSGSVVRTIDDIKGLKLRIGSDTLKPTAEALGAVPILMAVNELYDSLQKGVVDGTLLGTSAIRTFKLADVLDGLTMGNFFVNVHALGINKDSWAKISEDDQNAIMDLAGKRLAKITGMKFDSEGKVGYDDAVAAGVEIVTLPEAEMAKWKTAVAGIYLQWINDIKAKGLPGQEIYDKCVEFIKNYEK